MGFEEGVPYPDSDADDEYERSMGDASLVGDSAASPADSDPSTTAEPTPTTYAHRSAAAAAAASRFPSTIITDWSSDECAGFVSGIGLPQYADRFTENVILGEALVALQHDDLKSMGISSVGHRLTILKSVYDVKVAQEIPIEGDHYLPFAAEAESRLATATLKDVERLVDQLRLRDERMSLLEQDLRRTADDFKRLREDVLPALRLAKDAQQPLPNLSGGQSYGYEPPPSSSPGPTPPPPPPPGQMAASSGQPGVKRQYSQRKNLMGASSKSASPTQPTHERTIAEQALDPSTGLLDRNLLPAHMAAMNGSGAGVSTAYPSPNMPSPTSPQNQAAGATTLASRSYRGEVPTPYGRTTPSENEHPAYSSRDKPPPGRRRETPAPDTPGTANSAGAGGGANSISNSNNNNNSGGSTANANNGGSSSNNNSNSNASVEIFKSFRVSMDDPCYKVLPAALKKYQINAPWDQYALYIVYGDQERCLGMEEKPLILFKQLDKEGKKPMFMLRKTNTALDGDQGAAGGARGTSTGHDPPGGII